MITPVESDLSRVFDDSSHLHLLCWNICDDKVHQLGMKLLFDVLSEFHPTGDIVPMIRSIGRPSLDSYCGYEYRHGRLGIESVDWKRIDIYMSHCELWIQCSSDVSQTVWQRLETWIDENNHGLAFKRFDSVKWTPLGNSHDKGTYYPKTFCEEDEDRDYEHILDFVTERDIPWFVKLMWARGTYAMWRLLRSPNGSIRLLDPVSDRSTVKDLIKEALSVFDPSSFGLTSSNGPVDPSRYGVSHLTIHSLFSAATCRPLGLPVAYPSILHPWKLPCLESMIASM